MIISIDNPSNNRIILSGGEGKIYLNRKYLASFTLYVGEEILISAGIHNFTITGSASISNLYFRILDKACSEGNVSWYVEVWIHFRIDSHTTIVKSAGKFG
ncbi:MAG: hypothetical protein J7J22_05845 [Candidatus Verstraetearchaeota archaeon]|nr:hypothetical protein [Candidatus Verstraetearchaeota archaeon]